MKKFIFGFAVVLSGIALSGCAASDAAKEASMQKPLASKQTATGKEITLPKAKPSMETSTPAESIASKTISPITH